MKKIISVLLAVLMVASLATVAFAAESATVSGSNIVVEAGKEYQVSFTMSNAEFDTVEMYLAADDALTITDITYGDFKGSFDSSADFSTVVFSSNSYHNGGVLFTLTVKVADNAAAGTYNIKVEDGSYISKDGNDLDITFNAAALTIEAPVHVHAWGEWTVTTPATCQAEGVETRTCVCGETETRAIAKVDHTWGDWTVTTAATCNAEGVETRTCSVCGESETKAIAKTAHDWSDWTVTTAATCTAEGVETRTCSICGESETKAIAKVAHTTGEWACDGDNHWHVCSVCNEIVDLGAHDMKRTAILQTATKEGETTIEQYNCTVCNWKEIREYPWTKDEGDITGVVTTGIAALVIVLCSTVAIVNNKRKAI